MAASWVSISSAIQATNRATAELIKDIDKGNEEQTQTLLSGVKDTNRRLLEQIATMKAIQQNEIKAGDERQKLLESLERLLVSTGQEVQDVKKNTEDTAKHAETLASQKPKVVTKTVTKTRTRTRTVRPPTLYEKIFGTKKR